MHFSPGLDHFRKLKENLPSSGSPLPKKDAIYRQAFMLPKKLEPGWMDAVKEAEALICKTKDERVTFMKIKYPLVKYAASLENGHLVPNSKRVSKESELSSV